MKFRRFSACLCFAMASAVLVAVLGGALPLRAQIYSGGISGTVTDPSQAAVPDAEVTLAALQTGLQLQTSTDASGQFIFTALAPGRYTLKVAKSGFATAERKNIILPAGERLGLGAIVMALGAVSEVVSVEAEAAQVKTESSERSGSLTSRQVDNLLVIGRSVPALVQLLPGVVMTTETDSLTRDTVFSSQGGRTDTNNVSVDGVMSSDLRNGYQLKLQISQDAVSEVQILLSNYQAEHGRKSGAIVNMVTKSGSRDFHGLLSYFKRHEQFNAMNFFDNRNGLTTRRRYRYNTYTYNVGGPVYIPGKWNRDRDRLFFFWNQEFWPISNAANFTRTTPTVLERNGDFSQSLLQNGQLIIISDPLNGRAPFAGNRIPASRMDPNGRVLLNMFPEPNFFDRNVSRGAYNYLFGAEEKMPNRTETLKLDYNLNSRNQFSGTYATFHEVRENSVGFLSTNWLQMPYRFVAGNRGLTGRYTGIISPQVVNEFRVGWFKNPEKLSATPEDIARNLRSNAGFTAGQLFPKANPDGFLPNASFGDVPNAAILRVHARFPINDPYNLVTWEDKISVVRSRHLFKAGFAFEWAGHGIDLGTQRFGNFDFTRSVNNPLDTNYGYANAALGVYNSYTESSDKAYINARRMSMDWYVQDTWKAAPRLVLEYGMRFQWVRPTFDENDRVAGFAPPRFDPARAVQLVRPGFNSQGVRSGIHPVTGQVYPAIAIGAVAAGTGDFANGMVSPSIDRSYPRGMYDNTGILFAPRFGFSWDPFGTQKTVIRSGFGVFYNPALDYAILYLPGMPPLVESPTIYYDRISAVTSSQGFLFPSAVRGQVREDHMTSAMNYSFSVQQNIGFGTILDIAYVGSLGRHLPWMRNLNSVPYGSNFAASNQDPTNRAVPLTVNFLRPYQGLGNILYRESAASSNYHSLQVMANRRFNKGLEFGASYTWSKALDFVPNEFGTVSNLVPARQRDYGLSNIDRTHILKINWVADLPKTPWRNLGARAVLNDWQFVGIASFVSGQPVSPTFTTTVAMDITGSPTDGARIDVVGDPKLPGSERTFSRNFRTEMFARPAVGTIGNAGKTVLRGPGINNWDVAFFKNIPIWEPLRLQFRWELYNAFNHTQFASFNSGALFNPAGAQVNPGFGEYVSARAARRMQFALRLQF